MLIIQVSCKGNIRASLTLQETCSIHDSMNIPKIDSFLKKRLLTPLKYHVFENIMENGAFAPKEQILHIIYHHNQIFD